MTNRPVRLLVGVALAAALLGAGGTPAGAQGNVGDCDVRVAGQRFRQGSHVKVTSNRRATIAVAAFEEQPRDRVELEVAGVRSTVGTGRGRDFGWRRELNVPSYANYGVGTYRLHVRTIVDGEPCDVTGLMDITGRGPITTVAGGGAALLTLLAIIGLVAILFRRGGRDMRTRHGFGVDDPLGEFVAVGSAGDYVGWAEVACDLGARTFVTVKPSADAVREFMAEPRTHVRLAELSKRGVTIRAGDVDSPLPRIRWRPRPFVIAPLLGVAAAVGIVAYLQQAALVYPTPRLGAVAGGIGLIAGLVVANLARGLGAVGLNRRLTAAEAGLDEEAVEPRYPPIDHLDELDTFVWTPTHTVPDESDGLPAWEQADRSVAHVATLDPGLQVRVVDRRDGLAQIVCSNGWVGWTDDEPLEEITSH